MPDFSFVIPCYCSKNNLEHVVEDIKKTMSEKPSFSYEIVLVNDCSPDGNGTKDLIKKLSDNDDHIVGVNFSKNFGQHAALMAGFRTAKGDYIVTCDDDGQTPIESMWRLYDKLMEGYEFVCAKYSARPQKNIIRKMGSSMNEYMQQHLLGKPDDLYMSAYFIATRSLINEITRYTGPYPYLAGLVLRSTSKIANIEIEQKDRLSGKSGYRLKTLLKLWINGFTSFSIKPLHLSFSVGVFSVIASILLILTMIIIKIVDHSFIIALHIQTGIILFLAGWILISLGIVGEYIGRIFISINNSPQYVISPDESEKKTSEEESK